MVLVALVSLAACSGGAGTMNSSVPVGSQSLQATTQTTTQSQTRTTLDKPAPKADGKVVYDSIPKTLAPIPSQGFECCTVSEFGDGVNLQGTGTLDTVSVVMDSWGCQTGDGNTSTGANACQTTPGSTFNVPITMSVYAICSASCVPPNSRVGALLAQQTKTFAIPYRPSADPQRCPSDGTFFSDVAIVGEGTLPNPHCTHGFVNLIVFDNLVPQPSAPKNLPSQAIFTVAFNTSDWGYAPTGLACTTRPSDQCGYDSLNVGAEGPGGPVGSAFDPNGAFINYRNAGFYCDNGTGGVNYLRLDTGVNCWGPQPNFPNGLHPQIQVTTSNKNDNDDKNKGNDNDDKNKHGDNK
jgi:hypothetical protein